MLIGFEASCLSNYARLETETCGDHRPGERGETFRELREAISESPE